jgi:hypothetical protein
MEENPDMALYILRGQNYLRYLVIILLTGILLLGIYSIQFIGYGMLVVIIAAVAGLVSIPFPYLYLFNDHFVIEKKCILNKFSTLEVYRLNDIKEVEFLMGYLNWSKLIAQSLVGAGGYGGFSKPDVMVLKLKTGKEKFIYRFGSRKQFEEVISKLQKIITS